MVASVNMHIRTLFPSPIYLNENNMSLVGGVGAPRVCVRDAAKLASVLRRYLGSFTCATRQPTALLSPCVRLGVVPRFT